MRLVFAEERVREGFSGHLLGVASRVGTAFWVTKGEECIRRGVKMIGEWFG